MMNYPQSGNNLKSSVQEEEAMAIYGDEEASVEGVPDVVASSASVIQEYVISPNRNQGEQDEPELMDYLSSPTDAN